MTTHDSLARTIEAAFDARDTISTDTTGEVRDAVDAALNLLDSGEARVATRGEDGTWTTHQWLKKAVLLSFRLNPMARTGSTRCRRSGPAGAMPSSARQAFVPSPARLPGARLISPRT